MEAIKPGSTLDQWTDPFPQDTVRRRAHTVALPQQSSTDGTAQPTSSQPNTKSDSSNQDQSSDNKIEIEVRVPTPPPRSEISLRSEISESYDPYVKANEILIPPNSSWRNSKTSFDHSSKTETDNSESKYESQSDDLGPTYLKLLPEHKPTISEPQSPEHHHHYSTIIDTQRTSEIVAELEREFTPIEIDLLVKMLDKVSSKTKSGRMKRERRKSAGDSVLKVSLDDQTAKTDDSDGPYSQLADLMQDLGDLEPTGVLSEQNVLGLPTNGDDIVAETGQVIPSQHCSSTSTMHDTSESPGYKRRVPCRTSVQHGSLKEGSLYRQNAVRQRRDTLSTKPKETVTQLSKLCLIIMCN